MRICLAMLLLLSCLVFADEPWNGLVDNFENGSFTEKPTWWTFGDSVPKVIDSSPYSADPLYKYLGKFVLSVTGTASNYYVGGMGCYLGVDASPFTDIKLYVYGNGPDSGKIDIQLYDDDNNNTVLEQDPNNNYEPLYDDRFEYSFNVTWKGWKVVQIPITAFKDTNPKVGDNIWNPDKSNGSGGLLHFQFIFLSNTKTGNINYMIDNIRFITTSKDKKGANNEN